MLLLALSARLHHLDQAPLWVDEAESSINALTILERGFPADSYLGLPIFENTLVKPWKDSAEYEFRDISYSNGMAVYHGWLPLYAIAASFRLIGIRPAARGALKPQYDARERRVRTWAARLPSVLFGLISILGLYLAASRLHSRDAGLLAALIGAGLVMHIHYSQQARYYAATLAMSSLCAWSMAGMMRGYRWRDFVLGAVCLSLLFHAHLVTFVIVAAVWTIFVAFSPETIRSRAAKLTAFCGIVALLCGPWVVATGILTHTSNIPSAWTLMVLPQDLALTRIVASEFGVVLGTGALLLLAASAPREAPLLRRVRTATQAHWGAYRMLYVWLLIGYLAFVVLMPAASFFVGRMVLGVAMPSIVVVAMLLLAVAEVVSRRHRRVLSTIGALAFIAISNSAYSTGTDEGRQIAMAELSRTIEYLEQARLNPDIRMYASPNEHLVLTFYTGLPVQSIAPVRKEYLDTYPGEVLFLYRESLRPTASIRPEALRRLKGCPEGFSGNASEHSSALSSLPFRSRIASLVKHVEPPIETVPPCAKPAFARYLREQAEREERLYVVSQRHLMLRGMQVRSVHDWWSHFFYRFASPEERRRFPNYRDRVRNATVTIIPGANVAAFRSPGAGI